MMSFFENRRNVLISGVASAAALVGLGLGLHRYTANRFSPELLQQLWRAEFETPDGQTLSFSALQGRPLVLNFWATWCPPCVEEMPLLERFYRENKANGWQVVGIAVDQPSLVRQFVSQNKISYPIGLGAIQASEWMRRLDNDEGALPLTIVFDAEGQVAFYKLGKLSEDQIKSWV